MCCNHVSQISVRQKPKHRSHQSQLNLPIYHRLLCTPVPTSTCVCWLQVNSLVIAQTLGIRTLPWSGSELEVPGGMPAGSATVPPEVASGAWLTSRAQAETCAEAIGFPVLVHPSHKSPGKDLLVRARTPMACTEE